MVKTMDLQPRLGLLRFARLQDGLVLEALRVTTARNLVGFRLP